MKNENKIVELLSEYLLKTDRILDRLEKHDRVLDNHQKQIDEQLTRIDSVYQVILKNLSQIEELRKESLKRDVQHEVLLKEIFSISKRVQSLEEKNK